MRIYLLLILLLPFKLFADDVQIISAVFKQSGENWTVIVTLKHDDTGWGH